jgi:glutathione S-transferase
MLELYHYDRSSAAQKIRIALAEKGLEWESRVLNTKVGAREHLRPEYLKINPRGVVPTLVHDGRPIRESQIILEYLEDAFPEHPLRPADLVERANMRLWTKIIDEGLHVHSRVIGMCVSVRHVNAAAGPDAVAEYYKEMQEDVRRRNDLINIEHGMDSPLLPDAVAYFKKHFKMMDNALSENKWLACDTYSLADISHGVYVGRMAGFNMAPLWADLEHLNDWHARFKARPSFAEGVTRWGDDTSPKRAKFAADAFPKLEALWHAAD